jgi:hypothetical protein
LILQRAKGEKRLLGERYAILILTGETETKASKLQDMSRTIVCSEKAVRCNAPLREGEGVEAVMDKSRGGEIRVTASSTGGCASGLAVHER